MYSTCPNCGYCPHCGRGNRNDVMPRRVPKPYTPVEQHDAEQWKRIQEFIDKTGPAKKS
jgi:hypothetical protein